MRVKTESPAEKPDTLGESMPVPCELDAPEIHNPPSENTSGGRGRSSSISIPSGGSSISIPSGVAERKYTSVYSDESVRSYKGNVSNRQNKIWRIK